MRTPTNGELEERIAALNLDPSDPSSCAHQIILQGVLANPTFAGDMIRAQSQALRIYNSVCEVLQEQHQDETNYGTQENRLTFTIILALCHNQNLPAPVSPAIHNLSNEQPKLPRRIVDILVPVIIHRDTRFINTPSLTPGITQTFFDDSIHQHTTIQQAIVDHQTLRNIDNQPTLQVSMYPTLRPFSNTQEFVSLMNQQRPFHITAPITTINRLIQQIYSHLSPSLQARLNTTRQINPSHLGTARSFKYLLLQTSNIPSTFNNLLQSAANQNNPFILLPWPVMHRLLDTLRFVLPYPTTTLANNFPHMYFIAPTSYHLLQQAHHQAFHLLHLGLHNAFEFFHLRDSAMFNSDRLLLQDNQRNQPGNKAIDLLNEALQIVNSQQQGQISDLGDDHSVFSSQSWPQQNSNQRLQSFPPPYQPSYQQPTIQPLPPSYQQHMYRQPIYQQSLPLYQQPMNAQPVLQQYHQGPRPRLDPQIPYQDEPTFNPLFPFHDQPPDPGAGYGPGNQFGASYGGTSRHHQQNQTHQGGQQYGGGNNFGNSRSAQHELQDQVSEVEQDKTPDSEGYQGSLEDDQSSQAQSSIREPDPILAQVLASQDNLAKLIAGMLPINVQPLSSFGSNVAFVGSNLNTSEPRYKGPLSGLVSSNSVDNGTTTVGDSLTLNAASQQVNLVAPNNIENNGTTTVENTSTLSATSQPKDQLRQEIEKFEKRISFATSTKPEETSKLENIFPWGNTIPSAVWMMSAEVRKCVRRYNRIKHPDPHCERVIRQVFDTDTINKLEKVISDTPFRLPYEAFEHLIALNIASFHSVSINPKTVPSYETIKMARQAEKKTFQRGNQSDSQGAQPKAYTKPASKQSKRNHKKKHNRQHSRRSRRNPQPDDSDSSDEDTESDEDSWDDHFRNEDSDSSDDDHSQSSSDTPVFSNHGQALNPARHEPNLDTNQGVLDLITNNTATNIEAQKMNEFMEWTQTRNYDASRGNSRNGSAPIDLINKKTDIITALRLIRFCHESRGTSLFAFMVYLHQGRPLAKPADFIPPIPDGEDPRLRLQEEINADPELRDLPSPNDKPEKHQRIVKKLLQVYAHMFSSGSSDMYVARHRCTTLLIKDATRLLASLLELGRLFDMTGYTDLRFLSDNWQRMLLALQRQERLNGGSSNIISVYRTTAKETQDEYIKKDVKLNARQLMYHTVNKMQSALEGDRLITDAEETIGAGISTNRINFGKRIASKNNNDWNRRNRNPNAIRSSSGALQDNYNDANNQDYEDPNENLKEDLYFHMAQLSFHHPEQYVDEFQGKSLTSEEARRVMGHVAAIARDYESEQQQQSQRKAHEEHATKAQAEKQRNSILEQAKQEASKLVAEARTAMQNDLMAHQATIAQPDYIPTPAFETVDQDVIHSQSGTTYLEHPIYHYGSNNSYHGYADSSIPPPTIYSQPGGTLYKQQAHANMLRPRFTNPASQSMPKGYPPPPNPPNSGPPTPPDHCNICGLHKTECEAIGSRYTDPHTNISHCFLRDKTTGSFNLDFRALDALKLASLTKEKRDRVIAASVKNGVLYGIPPQTLAVYRERFNFPPAPMPQTNPTSTA